MRCALFISLLISFGQTATNGPEVKDWQRLVSIIQYLQSDYPRAVRSQDPQELEEQRGFVTSALELAESLGSGAAQFVPLLSGVKNRIDQGADPEGVERDCAQLINGLTFAGKISRSPRRAPDLKLGAQLYASDCAACHGADGRAQVEIDPPMNPRPMSFFDPTRMDELTPFKVFNGLTFGVTGTAMPSYEVRDDDERWALSFFIFTQRQPPCSGKPPRVTLEELSTRSDASLAAQYGTEAIPCLRQKLPPIDQKQSLLIARAGVENALGEWKKGNRNAARQAALDAYLTGIEPVEPMLRARNATIVARLEKSFLRFRADLEGNRPTAGARGLELLNAIDDLAQRQGGSTRASVFSQALVIILREGFEITVVLAALLAVLKKMQQQRHNRLVHAGWILALFCGLLIFWVGRRALSGARREWVEGAIGLLAATMLVYAALWLNARTNIRKFMGKLRSQMEGALGSQSAWGLFTISFAAMFRESFETAIFLEGLSVESPGGAAWGALAGFALLLAFVVFVSRAGYRLPMKTLFNISTVLLFAMAVVLLGKGIHSLQEVGAISVYPLPMRDIGFLGIYADAYSLLPQALLAIAPLVWLAGSSMAVRAAGRQGQENSGPRAG